MSRTAPTGHPIHPLLSERFSPYEFDPERTVSSADLRSLFEAARWAMSSYNAQPWRYVVGTRDRSPQIWQQVLDVLLEGNQAWAKYAPVLALGIFERNFEYNGKPNKAAQHDLGAASASLTVEAQAHGLCVHQMIGIDPERARTTFELSDGMEALTGLAIGYPGNNAALVENLRDRDRRPRERKDLSEIILAGSL